MRFRFELRFPDGGDVGSFETSEANWQAGDTVIAHGNRHFRVTAVVPVERLAEFVDDPAYGFLWSSRSRLVAPYLLRR
jgi:hypothetical protein